MMLKDMLISRGYTKVALRNLIRGDISEAVADAFRYSQLVLATTTYNADIFPPMREFINSLIERNFSNRRVALIENGSWVPVASKKMREKFEKSKNLEFIESPVKILSVLSTESMTQLEQLADELSSNN